MDDVNPRRSRLDLAEGDVDELLNRAAQLAANEIRAAAEGPIFAEPPSAKRLEGILDAMAPLPQVGESVNEVLEACAALLAEGRRTSPAFFGYVFSPAAPVGVAGDLLASAADQNVTSWRSAPAATHVERLVVRWLGEFVGFSPEADGILVSGGSMANLTALLLALRTRTEPDTDRRRLNVYASDEVHFSIVKAAEVLGVSLRRLPVDAGRRLAVAALRQAIEADRDAGELPFCVVASAGTTATGAIDPLDEIATVAADAGLWMHVDGAYGAPAAAHPASRHLFEGMERADSLAIDAHKWLYTPVDCGALLTRTQEAAFGSFAAAYVRVLADEAVESFAFWDHGLELSRRFRALKLWMTLRYYGARSLSEAIGEDITLARHMAELVRASDDLELLAEPSLSICCFRHAPPGVPSVELDEHNERLLEAIQRDGRAYLSNATIDGKLALRACITNFRTTERDVARTLELVRELGAS